MAMGILKKLFGFAHESKQAVEIAAAPVAPSTPQNTEPQLTDIAATNLFDIFGEPEQFMHHSNNFKVWRAEIEIGEAKERIANGEITGKLAQIIEKSIEALDNALLQKGNSDFNCGTNHFTIGYTYHKCRSRHFGYDQSHELSIGCPFGIEGAPRFEMTLNKNEGMEKKELFASDGNSFSANDKSCVWINKTKKFTNFIWHSSAPEACYEIGREFFNLVLDQYPINHNKPDNNARFVVGGFYGPSGIL